MVKEDYAFDYSQDQPDPEALRCIANSGLRFRKNAVDPRTWSTWDINISPDGIVYYSPICDYERDRKARLVAYDYEKDQGYICYDTKRYTLDTERQMMHNEQHASITFLPDGRIAATTYGTSGAKQHDEWLPFAHQHHVWFGFPGTYLLVYDPKTGEVENWGIPVPRETIYGMTYDEKYNCLYMIGFMKGHVYRFSIDDRQVIDLGKAAELFCYRLHRGPDQHIYGMTKSGYLWRINVDTRKLEDMNWRHPAYPNNSFNNTWYRYMSHARNISEHEFVFFSYASNDFYLFDTNTCQVSSLGRKFTHAEHNNIRHTELCQNEFAVDRHGVLWYMLMPVSLGHLSPADPRVYTLPTYLMRWDIKNKQKPENLGIVSDNNSLLSYVTGVCYDKERDILHLVGQLIDLADEERTLGLCSIKLTDFRPDMAKKGAVCRYSPYQFRKMTDAELEELEKRRSASTFPFILSDEFSAKNPIQAFPVHNVTPLRIWRQVPHQDIPASKIIGLAWDDHGQLHGLCGDLGQPQYYFRVEKNEFTFLGKNMAEVASNPTTWLYEGILGPFEPESKDNILGVRPPKAFSHKVTAFMPYSELAAEMKSWLELNLFPGKVELDQALKLPEVAGRRYLAQASYAVAWQGNCTIVGTMDGLLGIVRPGNSIYNLGNAAPYGPVRCMCTNASKTQLWGVAGDKEDIGMVFYYDDKKGLCQLGHVLYNQPNFMDCASVSNILSSLALSPDGKLLAIGGADRLGAVHIVDTASARFV